MHHGGHSWCTSPALAQTDIDRPTAVTMEPSDIPLWLNVGQGKIKPRYRFAETDIAEFIDVHRTRQEPTCRFSKSRVRKITVSTVGSKATRDDYAPVVEDVKI